MLMFEAEKWVMFDSACAKRDESRSCIITDGVWTGGGRRRKTGWKNDWHVVSHYGQLSHKRRAMSAVP